MLKKNKLIVGTHNKGKFRELCYLLPNNLKKISPQDLKIKAPKETGKTFKGNSILKAKYFFKRTKVACISDDSGLEVVSLNNKPGIYSARWAKKLGSFKLAMKKILKLLKTKRGRNAYFVCSLTLINKKGKIFNSTYRLKGKISRKILGKNGFGYDSIFIPQGYDKTFGQITKKKKMRIDHRFYAFKNLRKQTSIF